MSMFDHEDGIGCLGELLWALVRGFFRLLFSPLWYLVELIWDLLVADGSSSPPPRSGKRKDSSKK